MKNPTPELRAEVEVAVLADLKRLGPAAYDKAATVRRFLARGQSRATLYRWIDAVIRSAKPGRFCQISRHLAARSVRPEVDHPR